MTLALEASVATSTVTNFERGEKRPSVLSVSTIRRTLEGAGVVFLEGAELKLMAKPTVTHATWDPPPKR
jgi:hypothetical protein